jgi:hypothetical protein
MPQRVAAFNSLAQHLWKSKEPDAAEAKMDEIWAWIIKVDNSPQKIEAMLKLTALMVSHDTVRAFEWLNATAKALDSTDFNSTPVDFSRISVELQIPLDMLDLESSFGPLSKVDFERTISIAHSLTKSESALLAETVVCTNVLQAR